MGGHFLIITRDEMKFEKLVTWKVIARGTIANSKVEMQKIQLPKNPYRLIRNLVLISKSDS